MEFKTMNEEMNCSAGLDAKPTGADVNLRDPVAAPDVGHTPGPWRTHSGLVFFPDNAGGFSLQNCPSPEANARRIVAAINACEGISSKGLEKPTLFGAIGAERDRLRIERDTLRAEYETVIDERNRLEWDIEAYRGALGYSVDGIHSGRLTDGTFPSCGLCQSRAEGFNLLKNELQEALTEKDWLVEFLTWCVDHPGECLGDNSKILKEAQIILAKVRA